MLLITVPLVSVNPARAATFSVTTRIYVGQADSPSAEHRVLFDDGRAYDLSLSERRFATVYDSQQGQVILLDRKSEVQAVVDLEDLLKVTAEVKASVNDTENRQQLGVDAKVIAAQGNGYRIRFAGTEYYAETEKPTDPTIARDYGRFADLALRMNILRPLGPPPFARMTLNSHIAAKGEIVTLSKLTLSRGDQSAEYRSSNQIGELTASDRESIGELRELLTTYRSVALKDFPAQ